MKKTFTFSMLLLWLLSGWQQLRAQALDPTFQPTTLEVPFSGGLGSGVSQPLQAVGLANNKLLIVGGFDFSNGLLASKIQRLNADGTNDASFNPGGTGANGFIGSLLLLPDGSIIIAGGFTAYNGVPVATIARLTSNGALDPTFSSAGVSGIFRQIVALALQPNGKILVGGTAANLNNLPTGGLLRLNADGSRDASFNLGAGVQGDDPLSINSSVQSLLVQPDGKILVGGIFTRFNNQPASNLVRLNADGSRDASFTTGAGFTYAAPNASTAAVRALVLQPDGNLLVGGTFQTYDGKPSAGLVRLRPDGTLDNTLNVGTGFTSLSTVNSVWLDNDGRIVAGGIFKEYNGVSRSQLARLSSTGALDTGFGTAAVTGLAPFTIRLVVGVGNGAYVVLGAFDKYQGADRTGIAYLDAAGKLSNNVNPVFKLRGRVSSVTPLADAALLIQGNISEFNGQVLDGPQNLVRRVKADGTLDPTYQTTATSMFGGQANGTFYTLAVSEREQFQLQRILPSGGVDNSFTSSLFKSTGGAAAAARVEDVITQPDGRAVVFGSFATVGTSARNGIVRLLADGTVDNSFVPPAGTASRDFTKAFGQADGKLLVVYSESGPGANNGTFVERLNADGTPDPGFSIGTGAGAGSYFQVLVQRNGQMLVSGDFSSFNGQAAPGLVRLLTSGAVDNTFTAPGPDYRPRAAQASGHVLALTGRYGEAKLVRLNPNGSLDQSFAAVSLPQTIFSGDDFFLGPILQANDTKILLWGSFRSVLGQPRIGLARLNNAAVTTGTSTAKVALPVEIYPNPVQQAFQVVLPKAAGAVSATLTDALGRQVQRYHWVAGPTEQTVDVRNLPAGLYTLRLMDAQQVYLQRVLVVH